jgi:hypothetical protein
MTSTVYLTSPDGQEQFTIDCAIDFATDAAREDFRDGLADLFANVMDERPEVMFDDDEPEGEDNGD